MATNKTYTLVNGQPADATQVNKNFDDLLAGINADVSATDKVLGRATAGAGPVEEIPCTAAGRAILDDANAPAQIATLGAVATGDSRLSDARVAADVSAWAKAGTKPSYTYTEVGAPSTSDARLSDARPASDVSAWAKAGSKPTYTAAEVGSRKIATGVVTSLVANTTFVVTHGLGSTPTFVAVFSQGGGSNQYAFAAYNLTSTTFTISPVTVPQNVMWIAVA